MTREQLESALAAVEHALARRVHIVRVVCDPEGNEIAEVYQGSFTAAVALNEQPGTKGRKQ